MRSPAIHLLILLVALCVGFQSTASALGARCAMAASGQSDVMHAPAMDMSDAGMAHHHHHETAAAASALDTLVCQCGADCAMVSCVGAGPGIASAGIGRIHYGALIAFTSQEQATAPRSAHGLDLIRPPSRS